MLSILAAIAGLALATTARCTWGVTTFVLDANDGELLPFWITSTLPPISIAYGIGLAIAATAGDGHSAGAEDDEAAISSRLRETTAGGGGLKFGGVWTVLIVAQIAVTVDVSRPSRSLSRRAAWQVEDAADRRADGSLSHGRARPRESEHDAGAL